LVSDIFIVLLSFSVGEILRFKEEKMHQMIFHLWHSVVQKLNFAVNWSTELSKKVKSSSQHFTLRGHQFDASFFYV
jgi:hypothetical protein